MTDKSVHYFPNDISSKLNVMARMESKLASYDVAVQHVDHNTIKLGQRYGIMKMNRCCI